MGYSIAWVAFKNVTPEVGLERLGLYSTGRIAPYAESEFTGHALRDGWFLVVARGCDNPLVSAESLSVLSDGAEAVACSVEEHVMFSSAELWVRSQNVWRIAHDAQMVYPRISSTDLDELICKTNLVAGVSGVAAQRGTSSASKRREVLRPPSSSWQRASFRRIIDALEHSRRDGRVIHSHLPGPSSWGPDAFAPSLRIV